MTDKNWSVAYCKPGDKIRYIFVTWSIPEEDRLGFEGCDHPKIGKRWTKDEAQEIAAVLTERVQWGFEPYHNP